MTEHGQWAGEQQTRMLSGPVSWIVSILAIFLSVYVVLYISTFFDRLGIRLYGAHRAFAFSAIILLLFIIYPARSNSPRERVPWYDLLLGLSCSGASLYAALSWENWIYGVSVPTVFEEILAVVLIIGILEGARRVLGLSFALVGLAFVIYPLVGPILPGLLRTNTYSLTQLTQFFYLSGGGSGVFGTPMEIFTTTVAIFLVFGAFLQATGASDIFMRLALAMAGRFRAGMGKVAVLSSALFAMISGVGVANVMITGAFTIPAMKRSGYRPIFAAAVEATASTGGILMPPVMGAAAFLMADILSVPYWHIVVAAFLPALLYYTSIFLMVDAEGGKRALQGIDPAEIPPAGPTLLRGWYLFASVAVLLLLIGYWAFPVDLAALIAIVVLAVGGLLARGEFRPRQIVRSLREAGLLMAQIGVAGGVVGIIMSGFSLTGLGALLPIAMSAIAGDNLIILLAIAALASVILGMGAPPLLVYVILAATVAPALIRLGIPSIAAHLFIFYYGMLSMVTPPVAISVLLAARVAQTDFWGSSFEAVRLALVAFVIPFFFVFQPALLFQGTAQAIVLAMITALVGVVGLSSGLSRYAFIRSLPVWECVLLVVGGLMLIFPGLLTDATGIVLLLTTGIRTVVALRSGASRQRMLTRT